MVPDPYKVEDCCERLSSGTSFNLQKKILCTHILSKYFDPLDNDSILRQDIAQVFEFQKVHRQHLGLTAVDELQHITMHHTRTTTIAPSF